MASPHVAGVVALMKSVAPGMTPAQLDALLTGGTITEDLGAPGRDNLYGNGLIDARAAVVEALDLGGDPPPTPIPTLVATPRAINFGSGLTSATLQLTIAGEGSLVVSSVTQDSPGWLSVSLENVDASGLGTYVLSVSRGGLGAGTYSAAVTAVSTANTVSVPVVMNVSDASAADTGFQFILLVDPNTLDTLAFQLLEPVNGRYDYSFDDVEPGTYVIIGGTDLDYNFFLCHGGEACGSYPTLEQPRAVDVDRDLVGLDFGSGYLAVISAQASGSGSPSDSSSTLPSRGIPRLDPESAGQKSLSGKRPRRRADAEGTDDVRR
jgi:serine protease